MDRVRTSTFVNASGRSLAKPSHFDTAFVVEDLALHKLEGGLSGLSFQVGLYYDINLFFFFFLQCLGLRVAQVQLLFNLPPQFGPFPHPLAYIEWFTKIGSPDPNTGLCSVTRSTRQGKRNAKVVSVDRIVRACHLIPRFGHAVSSTWTTDNVLEQGSIHFFVNPYINVDTFTVLKPALFIE